MNGPRNRCAPKTHYRCPDGFGLGFFKSFDTRRENGRLWLYGPLFALNLVIAIDVDSFTDTTVFPGDLSGLFTAVGSGQIRIVAGSFPPPSDLIIRQPPSSDLTGCCIPGPGR